ncbi:uncharacterized protein [Bemisia tabaci]
MREFGVIIALFLICAAVVAVSDEDQNQLGEATSPGPTIQMCGPYLCAPGVVDPEPDIPMLG